MAELTRSAPPACLIFPSLVIMVLFTTPGLGELISPHFRLLPKHSVAWGFNACGAAFHVRGLHSSFVVKSTHHSAIATGLCEGGKVPELIEFF